MKAPFTEEEDYHLCLRLDLFLCLVPRDFQGRLLRSDEGPKTYFEAKHFDLRLVLGVIAINAAEACLVARISTRRGVAACGGWVGGASNAAGALCILAIVNHNRTNCDAIRAARDDKRSRTTQHTT